MIRKNFHSFAFVSSRASVFVVGRRHLLSVLSFQRVSLAITSFLESPIKKKLLQNSNLPSVVRRSSRHNARRSSRDHVYRSLRKKKTNKQIVRHRLSLRRHRNSSSFSAACRTVHLRTRLSIYSALRREGVSEPTPALGRHPFIHKSRCAMVFLLRQPDPSAPPRLRDFCVYSRRCLPRKCYINVACKYHTFAAFVRYNAPRTSL